MAINLDIGIFRIIFVILFINYPLLSTCLLDGNEIIIYCCNATYL